MSRDKKPEHLGFELSEGEGFNRDRVSVFLFLNLVVQSYAEHQIAGFGGKSEDLGLAAFMRELTGLFQGRYPDVLKGYGEEEGWSGKPFTAWLRARLADSLTEQDLDCFAWKDDAYLVHFAVSKMIVELHGLFAELLQEDKGMNDAQSLGGTILTFGARWSLILSGDETPLPDFADNTEVKFNE